jgi:hypothetical protein
LHGKKVFNFQQSVDLKEAELTAVGQGLGPAKAPKGSREGTSFKNFIPKTKGGDGKGKQHDEHLGQGKAPKAHERSCVKTTHRVS